MEIVDIIKMLYCLNEKGINKAYESIVSVLHNAEYQEKTPEQLENDLRQQREQNKIHIQKVEEKKTREVQKVRENFSKELKAIENMNIPANQMKTLKAIREVGEDEFTTTINVYNWGYSQGKKAERARRNSKTLIESAG